MKKSSLLVLCLLSTIVGCQKESALLNQEQLAASSKPTSPIAPDSLSQKGHYVVEKAGEYGYSQDAVKEGSDSNGEKPLLMVRYLGEQNGNFTVVINPERKVSMHVSCRDDCQELKVENRFEGQSMGVETWSAAGRVEESIMKDARAGLLKQYNGS